MDQIFVFVHRWFRRGEGWAYHPDMEGRVRDIAGVVAPRVLRGERGRFDIPLEHGMLLGEIVADTDCENATATARGASIAKVALLPADPVFQKNVDRLYRALQTVQPPSVEGPDGTLVIKYRGVPTPVPSVQQIESPAVARSSGIPTEEPVAPRAVTAGPPSVAEGDLEQTAALMDDQRSVAGETPRDNSVRSVMVAMGIAAVAQLIVLYASSFYGDLLLFLCGIVTLAGLGFIFWWLHCSHLVPRRCLPATVARWWHRRRSVPARPAAETDDERGR